MATTELPMCTDLLASRIDRVIGPLVSRAVGLGSDMTDGLITDALRQLCDLVESDFATLESPSEEPRGDRSDVQANVAPPRIGCRFRSRVDDSHRPSRVVATHLGEFFYLDKDELEESDSGTRLLGGNYEFSPGENTTLGVTYMRLYAHADMRPERDGLNVFNIRAYTAPLAQSPDLSFEFEYAAERNGEALDSNGWTLLGAYEFSAAHWKPKLSYRYAFFQGDDPATPSNEAFDPLLLGFYDWGTWWQGEIAGEYFLSNSNLISHQFRAHVQPHESISGGVIFYNFRLDQPQAIAPTVTNKGVASEGDVYIDWKLNKNFTASFILAFANPGSAVEQATGRTASFRYGMVYLGYSF